MARLCVWGATVLVLAGALKHTVVAQMPSTDSTHLPGIVPSGFGEAVDRDVVRLRDATARFKSTEAAEAAGYVRVTDCVEHQRTTRCSTRRSRSITPRCWCTSASRTAGSS
jgi:hypothetical protein